METKIEIKSVSGELLFEYEKEKNTVKDTLMKAVESGAVLRCANLRDANLSGANLHCADLREANLSGANLRDANLRDANLCDAALRCANLSDANLRCANLRCANLYGANLYGADLNGAYLRNADLCGANLCGADLSGANLCGAVLRGANLCGANLRSADLSGANLYGVDLYGADLNGAVLRNTDLSGAKNTLFIPTYLPEGEFIGWKKLLNGIIVKLKILSESKRSRANGDKCRCDKALVLEFQNIDGTPSDEKEYVNHNYAECTYKVGEVVYADSWDDNRWNECSHGINFFIDRQSAVDY